MGKAICTTHMPELPFKKLASGHHCSINALKQDTLLSTVALCLLMTAFMRKAEMVSILLNQAFMHKSSILVMTLNVVLAALMAKLAQMIKDQVPVGYQDENGFHYGAKK
jgi:hypothetical protein